MLTTQQEQQYSITHNQSGTRERNVNWNFYVDDDGEKHKEIIFFRWEGVGEGEELLMVLFAGENCSGRNKSIQAMPPILNRRFS